MAFVISAPRGFSKGPHTNALIWSATCQCIAVPANWRGVVAWIDSAAGPDEGGNQHALRGECWRGVIACNRFGGWTFQLQPSPLQQHLANIEVAGGGGEMQRRLSRVRPSMHVNERT